MQLEHPSLENFDSQLRAVHYTLFNHGLDALREHGLIRADREIASVLKSNKSAQRRFLRGCHYGFDAAQRAIGKLVIGYERKKRVLQEEIKTYRRARDSESVIQPEAVHECLERRQLVLRRLLDSILIQLLGEESWILRRTQVSDDINKIDPEVVDNTLNTACELNRQDRLCFHLVSDLTTSIQVGDLVKVYRESNPPRWEIIELKQGKVNDFLKSIVATTQQQTSEEVDRISSTHGMKTGEQLRRMFRQKEREKQVESFRTLDKGVDPKTKQTIHLHPEVVKTQDYTFDLRNACLHASEKGIAHFEVDGCCRVLVVDEKTHALLGPFGLAHAFYHLQHASAECVLISEMRKKEMDAVSKIWPCIDLLRANLLAMWPPPVFMWHMPSDMIFDIVAGRLILYAQIDFDKLFQAANKMGIEPEWVKDLKSPELAAHTPIIPGSPRSRAVRIKMPATTGEAECDLLSGFFARAVLEFMRPSQLLDLMVKQLSMVANITQ